MSVLVVGGSKGVGVRVLEYERSNFSGLKSWKAHYLQSHVLLLLNGMVMSKLLDMVFFG